MRATNDVSEGGDHSRDSIVLARAKASRTALNAVLKGRFSTETKNLP
jgi:hypothetical protein